MDRTRNEPRTADSADPRRHDQTYKGIFVRNLATRSLVCDFLARGWHPVLDLATIKFIRAESIGPGRRRRLPDFAVQVWFKDSEDSVVFLVEFQSSHDPSMALRTCDYVLGMIEVLHANSNLLNPVGAVPLVLSYVLYTGAQPWTAATSLASLTCTPKLPSAAARIVAGSITVHRYGLLDLQSASAQDLLPKDSVLGWLGALEREPWESFPRVHASMAKQWAGEKHRSLRESFAEWTDERMRAAHVPEDARRAITEQIIQPEEEAEMGQTYQEWAEGHRRKGREEGREEQGRALVVHQASRKFGAETAKRLEELVGSMGPEQLVRVGGAVVDCDTGDDLLAEANSASVVS